MGIVDVCHNFVSIIGTHRVRLCPASHMPYWSTTYAGCTMFRLQEFKATAHMSGFADEIKCDEGAVLWLKRKIPDAATSMCERMCIDSLTNSATVYWISTNGNMDSKVFRSPSE